MGAGCAGASAAGAGAAGAGAAGAGVTGLEVAGGAAGGGFAAAAISLSICAGIPCNMAYMLADGYHCQLSWTYSHEILHSTVRVIITRSERLDHLIAFEPHFHHVLDCGLQCRSRYE